jgi:hypothetical protein
MSQSQLTVPISLSPCFPSEAPNQKNPSHVSGFAWWVGASAVRRSFGRRQDQQRTGRYSGACRATHHAHHVGGCNGSMNRSRGRFASPRSPVSRWLFGDQIRTISGACPLGTSSECCVHYYLVESTAARSQKTESSRHPPGHSLALDGYNQPHTVLAVWVLLSTASTLTWDTPALL